VLPSARLRSRWPDARGSNLSKLIRKLSKGSFGKSVDTVADYVDLASQLIVEYFNQRYKIEKKVEDVKRATLNALYALKAAFIRSIVEALFLSTGLLALVIGIIILLSKVVPIEYVLIGYGLLVTIAVLLLMKVKA
jgi:hypothetical protein